MLAGDPRYLELGYERFEEYFLGCSRRKMPAQQSLRT